MNTRGVLLGVAIVVVLVVALVEYNKEEPKLSGYGEIRCSNPNAQGMDMYAACMAVHNDPSFCLNQCQNTCADLLNMDICPTWRKDITSLINCARGCDGRGPLPKPGQQIS